MAARRSPMTGTRSGIRGKTRVAGARDTRHQALQLESLRFRLPRGALRAATTLSLSRLAPLGILGLVSLTALARETLGTILCGAERRKEWWARQGSNL